MLRVKVSAYRKTMRVRWRDSKVVNGSNMSILPPASRRIALVPWERRFTR